MDETTEVAEATDTQADAQASASLLSGTAGRPARDYRRHGKRKRRREYLIYRRDNFRCVYCGKSSVEDEVKLEPDHIVPRSKGGPDTAGNFVTACQPCNRSKGDDELDAEDVERLQRLVSERNEALRIRDDLVIELGRV